MMQTEPNFNPSRNLAPTVPAGTLGSPAMTRTRCPGCHKLFAVETETLNAMARAGATRADFSCTGELCHEAFAIELPFAVNASNLTIVPATRIDKGRPVAEKIESPEAESVAAEPAPLVERQPIILGERECPRCGALNNAALTDCVRCGIIFDRYAFANEVQLEEEFSLGGTRELSAFWDRVVEDYEDRIRHDRFLNACRDANALSYASKKYSQILVAAPQDDIARHMRNRIVAMITVRAESSKLPIRLSFRIPKLNSMALFGGSILFVWGLAMPQLKNVMEIGLSLVLLAVGVRLALRARV